MKEPEWRRCPALRELRLDPERRLCPRFDCRSMALFPEGREMGMPVLDNCAEEHMM